MSLEDDPYSNIILRALRKLSAFMLLLEHTKSMKLADSSEKKMPIVNNCTNSKVSISCPWASVLKISQRGV